VGLRDFILVVDDDPLIVELVCSKLRNVGFRVTNAPDGLQAVIQVQAFRPKLIISDIQMPPWGTGPEALAEMRKVPALANVPVIFMTGMPLDAAAQLMPPEANVRLLSKPVDWTALQTTITELLGQCPPLTT
jgi:CheY-like chemotaxis protein